MKEDTIGARREYNRGWDLVREATGRPEEVGVKPEKWGGADGQLGEKENQSRLREPVGRARSGGSKGSQC